MKMIEFQGQDLRHCYQKLDIVVTAYGNEGGRGKRMLWVHRVIRVTNSSPSVVPSGREGQGGGSCQIASPWNQESV